MNSRINKICRPLLIDILPRERLFHLLDDSLKRPIVWVTGPGGSGKSSLIASYIDNRSLPCLWYQIDRGDDDVASLFYYLGIALDNATFAQPAALPLLAPEYQLGIETFSRSFFEKLFAALPTPCVVVFDDYQEVPDESNFHMVLRCGLYEIPQGINIIIASRSAPPPYLVHLRSQSRLKSVGWDALRLTPDETEGIVQLRKMNDICKEDTLLLHDRTQGWVAGLVLIIEGGYDETIAIAPGMQPVKDVFDYFAGELFAGMDGATQDFLLRTSYLPEIIPLVADKITGNSGAQRILVELHEKNCFTERHSRSEYIFRYHPLFREFLQERAEQLFTLEDIRSIQRDAATGLEETGRSEDAVELLLNSESWMEAARVIMREAPVCLAQGRSKTVLRWLERVPVDVSDRAPYLHFWRGACRFSEDPTRSFDDFKRAHDLFREQDDKAGICLSWAAGADATLYSDTIYQNWIPVIEEYMGSNPEFPSIEIEARVIASMFNAMSLQQPDHPRIRDIEARTYGYFCQPALLDFNVRLSTGVCLVVYNLWSGDVDKARFIVEMLRDISSGGLVSDLTIITIKTTEALTDFFTASFASCHENVSEAIRISEEVGIYVWFFHVMGHGIASALSNGDLATADALLAKFRANMDRAGQRDLAYYHGVLSWRARLEGDLDGAFLNLDMACSLLEVVDNLPCHAVAQIGLAEIQIHRANENSANRHLELARVVGSRMQSSVVEYMCLILEADMNLLQGRESVGLNFLGRAMAIGKKHKIMNTFWWKADTMARLSMWALRASIETDYVRNIVRVRSLVPESPPSDIEDWPWPVKIFTLGRFELLVNDKQVRFSGKVKKKPLEMLKILLAIGGTESREGQVADLLWPDAEGDLAKNNLKITLHRLRDLLGNEKTVQFKEGRLSLDKCRQWADIWAFEEMLTAAQVRGDCGDVKTAVSLTEKALALYPGHFLIEESDKPWANTLRARLQIKFKLNTIVLGNLWCQNGDYARAIATYLRGLEVDELAEELYQNLMECYLSAGLRGELVATYKRCKYILAYHGIKPSHKTLTIYNKALT